MNRNHLSLLVIMIVFLAIEGHSQNPVVDSKSYCTIYGSDSTEKVVFHSDFTGPVTLVSKPCYVGTGNYSGGVITDLLNPGWKQNLWRGYYVKVAGEKKVYPIIGNTENTLTISRDRTPTQTLSFEIIVVPDSNKDKVTLLKQKWEISANKQDSPIKIVFEYSDNHLIPQDSILDERSLVVYRSTDGKNYAPLLTQRDLKRNQVSVNVSELGTSDAPHYFALGGWPAPFSNPEKPIDLNIQDDEWTFALWADTHMSALADSGSNLVGYAFTKEKYQRLSEVIDVMNQGPEGSGWTDHSTPRFIALVGDITSGRGEWNDYRDLYHYLTGDNLGIGNENSYQVLKKSIPLYCLIGNHDAFYNDSHPAGDFNLRQSVYYSHCFGNFLHFQTLLNTYYTTNDTSFPANPIPEAINYSFDAGQWHFVFLSVPGINGPMMDDYFNDYPLEEWLAKDLQTNRDKPTMFFTHPSPLPTGRVHENMYGPNARHRGELMDTLSRYGNVKYVFVGHTHPSVSTIPQVSWTYRGMKIICLPNLQGMMKPFFDERYRSNRGYGLVHIKGDQVKSIEYRTLDMLNNPGDLEKDRIVKIDSDLTDNTNGNLQRLKQDTSNLAHLKHRVWYQDELANIDAAIRVNSSDTSNAHLHKIVKNDKFIFDYDLACCTPEEGDYLLSSTRHKTGHYSGEEAVTNSKNPFQLDVPGTHTGWEENEWRDSLLCLFFKDEAGEPVQRWYLIAGNDEDSLFIYSHQEMLPKAIDSFTIQRELSQMTIYDRDRNPTDFLPAYSDEDYYYLSSWQSRPCHPTLQNGDFSQSVKVRDGDDEVPAGWIGNHILRYYSNSVKDNVPVQKRSVKTDGVNNQCLSLYTRGKLTRSSINIRKYLISSVYQLVDAGSFTGDDALNTLKFKVKILSQKQSQSYPTCEPVVAIFGLKDGSEKAKFGLFFEIGGTHDLTGEGEDVLGAYNKANQAYLPGRDYLNTLPPRADRVGFLSKPIQSPGDWVNYSFDLYTCMASDQVGMKDLLSDESNPDRGLQSGLVDRLVVMLLNYNLLSPLWPEQVSFHGKTYGPDKIPELEVLFDDVTFERVAPAKTLD